MGNAFASRSLALTAAALLASVGAFAPSVHTQTEATTPASPLQKAQRTSTPAPMQQADRFFGWGGNGSRGWQRRRGPGWTHAQAKRMARKRRNVLRNRRAHR